MQQGCRECGIEGPSSNFGHQGVFWAGKFQLQQQVWPLGGVLGRKISTLTLVPILPTRRPFWGKFLRFFFSKRWIRSKNFEFQYRFWPQEGIFWGKIKNFWPPSWHQCGPETGFCRKIIKNWLFFRTFLVNLTKFDKILQFFFV